jgi:aerobic carbon-monoxide dehydrogenase medium subunit
MFPAKFEYHAPSTLDEAIKLLADGDGDVKVLAGGHSLLPLMKLRLAQPKALVDISKISGLSGVKTGGGWVAVGALTTHAQVATSEEIKSKLPLLAECAATVGDLQVRNCGTLGGSLAHADPAGDLPAAALALNAEMKLRGPNGERGVKAQDFFVGLLTSALETNEILTEVHMRELPANSGSAYLKFDHPASHYAICGVAVVLTVEDGHISDARVAITGVADKAYRAEAVEAVLKGHHPDAETITAAAQHAAEGVEALGDLHASSEYRAHLARVYTRRALEAAAARVGNIGVHDH